MKYIIHISYSSSPIAIFSKYILVYCTIHPRSMDHHMIRIVNVSYSHNCT